jgi:hypothetical protein
MIVAAWRKRLALESHGTMTTPTHDGPNARRSLRRHEALRHGEKQFVIFAAMQRAIERYSANHGDVIDFGCNFRSAAQSE